MILLEAFPSLTDGGKVKKNDKGPHSFSLDNCDLLQANQGGFQKHYSYREGNSISSQNKQPCSNKPSEDGYCSFPQKVFLSSDIVLLHKWFSSACSEDPAIFSILGGLLSHQRIKGIEQREK